MSAADDHENLELIALQLVSQSNTSRSADDLAGSQRRLATNVVLELELTPEPQCKISTSGSALDLLIHPIAMSPLMIRQDWAVHVRKLARSRIIPCCCEFETDEVS